MALEIDQYLDVLLVNGIYYLLRDSELRDQVEGWSKIETLDPTSDAFVPSHVIYEAIQEVYHNTNIKLDLKLNKAIYESFLSVLTDKRIAFTASYKDLVDVPSFGGARVEDTTLVFTGESTGQEKYLLEQLDLTADVIGTGEIFNV